MKDVKHFVSKFSTAADAIVEKYAQHGLDLKKEQPQATPDEVFRLVYDNFKHELATLGTDISHDSIAEGINMEHSLELATGLSQITLEATGRLIKKLMNI